MRPSIVICIIQTGSVLLPLCFALRLVYKATHKPAGRTENWGGSFICFTPVSKQLSAALRQRCLQEWVMPLQVKIQGAESRSLFSEPSLWHVCHSHQLLSQEKERQPQIPPTVRHVPRPAATAVTLLPYTLPRAANKGQCNLWLLHHKTYTQTRDMWAAALMGRLYTLWGEKELFCLLVWTQ